MSISAVFWVRERIEEAEGLGGRRDEEHLGRGGSEGWKGREERKERRVENGEEKESAGWKGREERREGGRG